MVHISEMESDAVCNLPLRSIPFINMLDEKGTGHTSSQEGLMNILNSHKV